MITAGTPHYGVSNKALKSLIGGLGLFRVQVNELTFGSSFLWKLHDQWNVKGSRMASTDMLAVVGTIGADCSESNGDGVVGAASASMHPNFLHDSQVRYVPYQHPSTCLFAKTLVGVDDDSHLTYQLTRDFLMLEPLPGPNPPADLAENGLLLIRLEDTNGDPIPLLRECLSRGQIRLPIYCKDAVKVDGISKAYFPGAQAGTITLWPITGGNHTIGINLDRLTSYTATYSDSVEIVGGRSNTKRIVLQAN